MADDPVDPIDPEDALDPEDPVDPEDPEDPVDPEDAEDPEDPIDPEDPADPVDPEDSDAGRGGQGGSHAKPTSRSQRRVQAALREARDARERAERLERDLEEMRRGNTGRNRAEEEAAERERLALMTPEERTDYLLRKQRDEILGEVRRGQFVTADQNDKAAFAARAASDPLYRRYEERVEKELQTLRARGQNVSREALLSYLIGQDALKRRGEVAGKQRRKAAEVRRRETAKPGSGRGDAPAQRGKAGKTARERLEGVTF